MSETKLPYTLMTQYYCITDMNFIPLPDTVCEKPEDSLWAAVTSIKMSWSDLRAEGHKIVRLEITIASERTDVERILARARAKYLFRGPTDE